MSNLRVLFVEIETEDDHEDYDLIGALTYLAATVAAGTSGLYRLVVTEDRHVIFRSAGGDRQ